MCCVVQREDSFKKKPLVSLSKDLISAKQKLSHVNHQHTACLEAFLNSEKLVNWVKSTIESKFSLNVSNIFRADKQIHTWLCFLVIFHISVNCLFWACIFMLLIIKLILKLLKNILLQIFYFASASSSSIGWSGSIWSSDVISINW